MSLVLDPANELTYTELLAPAARTSSANGSGVDLQSFKGSAAVLLQVGTVSGTSPTLDVKVQDSADNSSFADVSGYTFAQKTAADTTPDTVAVDLRAVRRYMRVVATIAGTSPSFTCAALLVAQKERI